MAAKIFALLALLALSVSATTVFIIPHTRLCSPTGFSRHLQLASYNNRQLSYSNSVPYYSSNLAHLLAAVNSAAYSQQQLLPLNQLAVANSAAFSQQLFNPLAVAHPAAFWQQQQLVNQLALMSPAAFLQQPIVGSTIF
ncbi:hypothetical protein PVAP13_8KG324036 [Panicum virgatum]|uniref:Uncharacterized protein n=1 Tax=Panicum virgatum TaxID=38727 RepID=A0A8T0PSZ2_PANVG|nr:hypothetical protein PVAP13_8KG324036 [Panicum virgatum]